MSLSVNTKTYTADRVSADSVGYVGPADTLSSKDEIILSRVEPKPTPTFSGVARFRMKVVRTHTLTGALTPQGGSISALEFSLPVGIADADVDAICADIGTYVNTAGFKSAVKKLTVNM